MRIVFNGDYDGDLKVIFSVNGVRTFPKYGFEGRTGEVMLYHGHNRLYVGIGENSAENVKTATAAMMRALFKYQFRSLKISLPRIHRKDYLVAFFEGLYLGRYNFDKYKSEKKSHPVEEINIQSRRDLDEEYWEGRIKGEAINFVRDIVNSMPDEFTPQKMAETAEQLAEEYQLECKILDEKELEAGGFGAITAVGRASAHPPRLIHLIYKPHDASRKNLRKIAIVGKGLCYDSGGLSLKPTQHMVTMKLDKAGGATALGIIKAAAEMQLPIELHVVVGAVENMIGGNAYKPDDVIVAKNGTTIEVRNTDAEGRLVLADCLSYIQEEVPDLYRLIDIATLTGACVVGLGEYTGGVMGHNKKMIGKLIESGERCGECWGHLPFNQYLPKLLESKVADLANVASSRYGGALTAALFLDRFINERNKRRWLHLDIAGPAYTEKGWGPHPYGATGFGVSTLLTFLKEYI